MSVHAKTEPSSRFYQVGGTMDPASPSYVERRADHELYSGILRGDFCYVLTSRQMGKSSLMARTCSRLKEAGMVVAPVDLTTIGFNNTLEQWYDGLFDLLGRRLNLEDELFNAWEAYRQFSPLNRFMKSIEEVVLPRLAERIVIFVDEIDLVRSLKFSVDEFFGAIRECYNRRPHHPEFKRLSFCLIGVASPSDLIRDDGATPFNIGCRVELGDFQCEELEVLARGLEMAIEGAEGHVERGSCRGSDIARTLAQRLINRLVYWTHGHPYLTQKMCGAVNERLIKDPCALDPKRPKRLVDQVCQELFLQPHLKEDNLDYVAREIQHHQDLVANLLNIYERVWSGKRVEYIRDDRLHEALRLSGIVSVVRGNLEVRNRIYRQVFGRKWIRETMPDAERRRQRIAFQKGMLRSAGIAGLVVVLLAIITVQSARNARAERIRLTVSYFDNADRLVREGDALMALPWLVGALDLLPERSTRAEQLRTYWGVLLQQTPQLTQLWFQPVSMPVWHASFSPDGGLVAAACDDDSVYLWSREKQNPVVVLAGHTDAVRMVSFAPQGDYLVTASFDKTVRLWRLTLTNSLAASQVWRANMTSEVYAAKFSPDGAVVVSGAGDGTVTVLRTADARVVAQLDTGNAMVEDATFDPTGRFFVTASHDNGEADNRVQTWDARTWQPSGPPLTHPSWIYTASFDPAGDRVVTACYDGKIRIWDRINARMERVFPHRAPAKSARFSPDGRYLVAAYWDRTVRVWDVEEGLEIHPPIHLIDEPWNAAFGPSGREILIPTKAGVTYLWDFALNQRQPSPRQFKVSDDGQRLFERTPSSIRLRSPGSDASRTLIAQGLSLDRVLPSRDGRRVLMLLDRERASGPAAARAQLWDTKEGKPVGTAFDCMIQTSSTNRFPQGVVLGPEGRFFVLYSQNWAQMWNAEEQRPAGRAVFTPEPISKAFVRPGHHQFVTIARTDALLWDRSTGRLAQRFPHAKPIVDSTFSPDGRLLATACSEKSINPCNAYVWDATTGERIGEPLHHGDGVESVAFSPDGKRLVTASEDRTAQLWRLSGSRVVKDGLPMVHEHEVISAFFGPEGRSVVTSCRNQTVRVWDAMTSRPITPPIFHDQGISFARFLGQTPDLYSHNTTTQESWLWHLDGSGISINALTAQAEFLSGRRWDQGSSRLMPLNRRQLRTCWDSTAAQVLAGSGLSTEMVKDWHRRQVNLALEAGQWGAVQFHLMYLCNLEAGTQTRVDSTPIFSLTPQERFPRAVALMNALIRYNPENLSYRRWQEVALSSQLPP